jgi:cysteine desulfurase
VTYLDHAASTPMLPQALAAFAVAAARPGNASSLHGAGRAQRRVVEESREQVAASLCARPSEVIFTSGGTEADNLAIKGVYWGRRAQDPRRTRLVVSAIEHHGVLDPALWLADHEGAQVVLLPVDRDGIVDLDALRDDLSQHPDETALVSVMLANNEVGSVEPLAEVVRIAHEFGVPVHSDAVQAIGQLPVSFRDLGVDALSLSGHKFGGPVGVGALLACRELPLAAVLHGGGQERGVRSGTLDVPGIRALAVALTAALAGRQDHAARLTSLRDGIIAGVRSVAPDAQLRGPDPALRPAHRLPGNAHFTFPGCDGDSLLYLLDCAGVQVSTGSACQAGLTQPSHVLIALGLDEAEARGALRFSLGATSSPADVSALLDALPAAVKRARAAGLVGATP